LIQILFGVRIIQRNEKEKVLIRRRSLIRKITAEKISKDFSLNFRRKGIGISNKEKKEILPTYPEKSLMIL